MRSLGGALGVACGVVLAALVALSVLPLPANVAASTVPAQLAIAFGLIAGLRVAEQHRPDLARLRRTLEIAFLLAAAFVALALLGTSVSQEAIALGKKGACSSGYYLSDGLCHANALHRRFFPGWIVGLSSLGLVTWIGAFVIERRRKAQVAGFTALLLGLGLGAATLQNAHYLDASLSLDGDRVRAWNVFHYYLGSKYYRELGHQDIYAAVLAADDDYQARVLDSGKSKRSKAFRSSWQKIETARDLRSYKVLPRDELVDAFDRSPFTDARLRELGSDSRFFKRFMGWGSPGWHDTFRDLGFNPAPPWTVIGTPLASLVPTEWPVFWIISNSDLPFYLLAFGLIWWAFGLRMAAVMTLWLNCAQLNEARFTGGFLQYDWLVSSLACIAFYRRGWYRASAVALSWGAMTRVFPGFLVFPIGLRVLGSLLGWDAATGHQAPGRLQWGVLRRIQPRHWQFSVALTLSCAFLFTASCVTGRGFSNWADWYTKIEQHSVTHPITSNQRIGVGRLAVHQPRSSKGAEEVSLWERMTAKGDKHRFWRTIRGVDKHARVEASQSRKRFLQMLALPLLLLALLRRRDLDGMILMLFGVFIAVTVSRYYAATWALLFALGHSALPRPGSEASEKPDGQIAPPALFIGGVLLALNALFFLPQRMTTSYYAMNYIIYGAFMLLCLGYIAGDVRALLARRRRHSDTPSS